MKALILQGKSLVITLQYQCFCFLLNFAVISESLQYGLCVGLLPEVAEDGCSLESELADDGQAFGGDASEGVDVVCGELPYLLELLWGE